MTESLRTLLSAAALADSLGDPHLVVVDCRFSLGDPGLGGKQFALSRIPGARYAHLDRDLAGARSPATGRHPLPEPGDFAQTLARWGITPQSKVVVYDDSFGAMAVRLWWMLRWVGHQEVALLDGGWPVWKRAQLPIETGPPASVETAAPYPVRADADAIVDARFVDNVRQDPGWCLLDARAEERFTGEREMIDPVAGHIPGSRNRSFEDNLGFDGCFLSADELRASFLAALGTARPENAIHTCGSGVTACHNLLAMAHAGLPAGRLYPGSWSEWITDPARPVARGPD